MDTSWLTTAWANPKALSASLWLIIALPALGAVVCGLLGRALGRTYVNLVACATVLGSFILSVFAFQAVAADPNALVLSPASGTGVRFALAADYGTWFSAGSFVAHFGLWVDHLTATMLLVVTGVGFLIHLYSTGYMAHDEGYWRFFSYLNLFMAMMLTLVLADNLVLLFVGWEGVGLCSYLLIGYYYTDAEKAWAGRKAFIANRVGDCGFIVAMMLIILTVTAYAQSPANDTTLGIWKPRKQAFTHAVADPGPLNFQVLEEFARVLPPSPVTANQNVLETVIPTGPLAGFTYGGTLTVIFLFLLLGATGKSAQLPLYVWLPDAMAGPTPVSALIHAATMVTAGVYLLCRMSPLLALCPKAMAVVAVVGAVTALFAALIAFAQDDMKKILAYSTISQLGYMFLGVGVGIYWAAILHLVTHACFKGCLFLSAGSVMHGNADELDIKRLGALRKAMPWTTACFAIATATITGIIPLSGFWSKDDILDGALHAHLDVAPWVGNTVYTLGMVGAVATAFYMTRLYLLAFTGERSKEAKTPAAHESGWVMVAPLVILATLSVLLISHGIPGVINLLAKLFPQSVQAPPGHPQTLMEIFLRSVFDVSDKLALQVKSVTEAHVPVPTLLLYAFGWLVALVGGAVAWVLYKRVFPARAGQPVPALFAWVRSFTVHKFYVDELYNALIIQPIRWLAIVLYRVVDQLVIDTAAVAVAWIIARVGSLLRYFQSGNAQAYAAAMAVGLLVGAGYALFQVIGR